MGALAISLNHPVDFLAGGACCLLENRLSSPPKSHVLRDFPPAVAAAISRVHRLPLSVLDELTPAERRVLVYLCAGYSNKEIASALGRAEATVKHQVSACLRKLGVPSRARLIAALR
jgi:DNA-binding NarL/FixJ family response regulator